jgi:hypothetical protein
MFLITIDTEGDNLWSAPRTVTTRNASFLPRFQTVCEAHALKPTYLTDYHMAQSPNFREFGLDVLRRQVGEVGMHLHAWDSPPLVPLTEDDLAHQPYLMEYPADVMREKVRVMTGLLEETFGRKMISHRAGRWGLDDRYARILHEEGYRVDCSVTPHKSWATEKGNPNGPGGPDYSCFPNNAYYVNLSDISRPGESSLLEVPLTVMRPWQRVGRLLHWIAARGPRHLRALANRCYPPIQQLRPRRHNLSEMLSILRRAREEKRDYVEFMLHSSEFMPGGSPTFRTDADIEHLYDDLNELFTAARNMGFQGATLVEYARQFDANQTRAPVELQP